MSSLAAFAPTAAFTTLKARPTTARRVAAAVRAEAPNQKNQDAQKLPVINTRRALLGGAVGAAVSLALTPGRADAKDGKNGVYWIAPKDGATVPRKFTVKMGVKGFEVGVVLFVKVVREFDCLFSFYPLSRSSLQSTALKTASLSQKPKLTLNRHTPHACCTTPLNCS
jgi:hypothetical protein